MAILDIRQIEVAERRVLVRSDLDVPMNARGGIADDCRIKNALETIQHLLRRDAKVVVMGHLGRPKGNRQEKLSLIVVAQRMSELLGRPVKFLSDYVGSVGVGNSKSLKSGEVLLLENLRFCLGEEANDTHFAAAVAKLGDEYVNDAFGTSVRAHASIAGITHHFGRCVAGLNMIKEVNAITTFRARITHPLTILIGGKKATGKLRACKALLGPGDKLLLGGVPALALYKACGRDMGSSMVDASAVDAAGAVWKKAQLNDSSVVSPEDFVLRQSHARGTGERICSSDHIEADWDAVDIGPRTRARFVRCIRKAHSVVWSGPMGVYEDNRFIEGTLSVAGALAALVSGVEAQILIGGGDTAASLKKLGLDSKFPYLSVAGEAMLRFLSGESLPGLQALRKFGN